MQQLESVFERCRQMLLSEELSEFDALSEQTWPRTTAATPNSYYYSYYCYHHF